ncbi:MULTISPECIES: hypothetical protein [unclassified Paraburkholderia]|uniref:hypothetical protein n=1 Tax=unclassified Paraburkholderia TaxID=2615204 RepID=UPI002AB0B7B3|nr:MULTISPECIES: hypothetical protein [unclassified Paraburkholderia]
MTSKLIIGNRALTKLGEQRITSFDEDSKAAETLNSMWDVVLKAELRANVWSFAKARAKLAASSTAPAFGFARAFPLPTDWVRNLQVGPVIVYPRPDTRGLFSVEGRSILTDLPAPLHLRYIAVPADTSLFDDLFVEVLACRLAAECAEPITQNSSKAQTKWQEYASAVAVAKRANALERPSQAIADDTWMEARGAARDHHHHWEE